MWVLTVRGKLVRRRFCYSDWAYMNDKRNELKAKGYECSVSTLRAFARYF